MVLLVLRVAAKASEYKGKQTAPRHEVGARGVKQTKYDKGVAYHRATAQLWGEGEVEAQYTNFVRKAHPKRHERDGVGRRGGELQGLFAQATAK